MELNEEQIKIINSNDNQIMVVASAGSGKTHVLVEKVAKLVAHDYVNPSTILLLTFSNKAANELKVRLNSKILNDSKRVNIKTFHAFSYQIIRKFLKYTNLNEDFKIIDNNLRNQYISTIMNQRKISRWIRNDFVKLYDDNIREFIHPDHKILYEDLKQKKIDTNSIEIDDLIIIAKDLIKNEDEVYNYAKSKYQYILIDEFQDINKSQFNLVNLLRKEAKQFIVVGDDDQCIYEWRGSDPRFMDAFSKTLNITKYYLRYNYRSTEPIISLANNIIGNNKNRIGKSMVSIKKSSTNPIFKTFLNVEQEASFIAQSIHKAINETTVQFNEISILLRKDTQSTAIVKALKEANIPFNNHNLSKFANMWLLDYLQELVKKEPSVAKLLNYPKYVINNITFLELCEIHNLNSSKPDEVLAFIYNHNIPIDNQLVFKQRYETITRLINHYNEFLVEDILELIFKSIIDEIEPVDENISSIFKRTYDQLIDFKNTSEETSLEGFIEYLLFALNDLYSNDLNGINIMTLHKSKGLEFETVYIPGLTSGIFPDDNFIRNNDDLEAERRLLYVGITRAKKNLIMTNYYHNTNNNKLNGFSQEIIKGLNLEDVIENPTLDIPVTNTESIIKKTVEIEIKRNDSKIMDVEQTNNQHNAQFTKLINEWNLNEFPVVFREVESLINNSTKLTETLTNKNTPNRNDLLYCRAFISGPLKVFFDMIFNSKTKKIADYLPNNSLSVLEIHKKLLTTKKLQTNYSTNNLKELVELKQYLDALHHQFEKNNFNNKKTIDDFNKSDKYQQIKLINSPIKFLNSLILTKDDIHVLNESLKIY